MDDNQGNPQPEGTQQTQPSQPLQATQTPNTTPQMTDTKPAKSGTKIKSILIILIVVIAIGLIVFAAVNYFGNTKEKSSRDGSSQKTQASDEFTNPAEVCSNKPKTRLEDTSFERGQVIIGFYQNIAPQDVKSFLAENNLTKADYSTLDDPTGVIINWTSEFMDKQKITLREVNEFYSSIRNEPYIEEAKASTFWHTYPIDPEEEEDTLRQIQEIDRWGYFTLTFSDISQKDAFFAKYPEATFYSDGEVSGIYFSKADPNKVTILYKADAVVKILNSIKKNIGVGDVIEIPSTLIEVVAEEEQETQQTITESYPVLYIWDRVRNETNTSFVTGMGVHFPSSFYPQEIREELSKYQEINLENIEAIEFLNTVAVEVPSGEEQCWVDELTKAKEVEYAELNVKMEAF